MTRDRFIRDILWFALAVCAAGFLFATLARAQEPTTANLEIFLEYVIADAKMPGVIDGNSPWSDAPNWDATKSSGHWSCFRFRGQATNENLAKLLEAKAKLEGIYPFAADQLKQVARQIRVEKTQLHEILANPGDGEHYDGAFWQYRASGNREVVGHVAVKAVWRYLVSPPGNGQPAVHTSVPLNVVIRHVNVWESEPEPSE